MIRTIAWLVTPWYWRLTAWSAQGKRTVRTDTPARVASSMKRSAPAIGTRWSLSGMKISVGGACGVM